MTLLARSSGRTTICVSWRLWQGRRRRDSVHLAAISANWLRCSVCGDQLPSVRSPLAASPVTSRPSSVSSNTNAGLKEPDDVGSPVDALAHDLDGAGLDDVHMSPSSPCRNKSPSS